LNALEAGTGLVNDLARELRPVTDGVSKADASSTFSCFFYFAWGCFRDFASDVDMSPKDVGVLPIKAA
jgi:hypothetical protein